MTDKHLLILKPDNTIEFTAQGVNSMTTSYQATTMNLLN